MAAVKFAVVTVFGAKDENSKAFKTMSRNARNFGNTSEKAFKKASKQVSIFGSVLQANLGAQVVGKTFGLIGQGMSAAATGFLDFDQAITSASAKFKGLDLTTKKGQKTLEALKTTARVVGRDTEFSADQAAGGLDFLALAGFNAKQAMALLPGVTNLATVANVDLATATDIASDSLGAFGLMTDNTAQLAKNFTRVQDVMAKTTATSNTNLTDMFEAVKKGGPDFTAAGQSIETFSALVGVMATSSIKGSEAGTKIRNFMVRLSKPTKEAQFQLDALGVKTADANGNFRDMLDIIDDVRKGTEKLGSKQKLAALATIFGSRQSGGFSIILKEGTERLRSYRQMLTDSTGASKKMADIMRSSLTNRLKSLGSAALEVGFQIFDAFDEKGAKAVNTFTMFLREVNLKPFLTDVIAISERLVDMAVNSDNFAQSIKTFQAFGDTLKSAGTAFDTFSKIFAGAQEKFSALDTILIPITKNLQAVEIALQGIAGAINVISRFGRRVTMTETPEEKAASDEFVSNFQERGGLVGMGLAGLGVDIPRRRAPQQDIRMAQQNVNVGGTIDFRNAPEGTSFTPSAPEIDQTGLNTAG